METTVQRLERLFNSEHWREEDREWLRAYLDQGDLEELRLLSLEQFSGDLLQKKQVLGKRLSAQLLKNIHSRIDIPVRKYPLTAYLRIAASIIIALSFGGYFLFHKTAQLAKNDIQPASNKAILIAGGNRYVLSGTKNGQVTKQASKTANGILAYHDAGSAGQYDTLVVPRGGQHELELADGTDIWLNADSKIRYPEVFSGKERLVELISGEAYVSVGHLSKLPFRFLAKGQNISDIGTEFDVNAYDEASTTLVKGEIEIAGQRLQPGQALSGTTIRDADISEVIAWHQGMFRFNGTPLATIMQQVSRWYDVQVIYQDPALKNKTYFAVSTRFANVSQLLKDLELAGGVKFAVSGRTITVLNP